MHGMTYDERLKLTLGIMRSRRLFAASRILGHVAEDMSHIMSKTIHSYAWGLHMKTLKMDATQDDLLSGDEINALELRLKLHNYDPRTVGKMPKTWSGKVVAWLPYEKDFGRTTGSCAMCVMDDTSRMIMLGSEARVSLLYPEAGKGI